MNLKRITKLLVANRSEIAIRIFRAATELNIRTVAVFTHEDRYSLHRYKADESYQIGSDNDPLKPYLDINEIIGLAKRVGADAIHPGYGFLSENVKFAQACKDNDILFIGPEPEVMMQLGDKVRAKEIAIQANVPIIRGNKEPLSSNEIARAEAQDIGYPVMLKAAAGGGGRGMRIVRNDNDLIASFTEAKSEALSAFGDDTIFLEKYVEDPKHIEIQIMADNAGNIVHLFERDCSLQRRFQKVIEVAPCQTLQQETKNKIYEYAVSLCKSVNYNNVGTVEFLVSKTEEIFFIEVNPRIQVEHTITEEITGIDIVRSQIQIARGYKLADPQIFLQSQQDVKVNGYAIQCRITTEDPENNFRPDFGTILAFRSATGFGIRLDAGNAFTGSVISPFFDSMLVKVSASGRTLKGACDRMKRALSEFRVRGVKTNIQFLENVVINESFRNGEVTVGFMEKHPNLFDFKRRKDRSTKALKYIANVIVNGNEDVKFVDPNKVFIEPKIPTYDKYSDYPKGTKDLLNELGRDKFLDWVKENKNIQYTDTTFRDAHQSLLATRVRTIDMLAVAEGFAKSFPNLFSMEVWGGATFDVCLRFLHESPWTRLQKIREAIPNILTQMLIRSSNAVGYTAYPDNLVEEFIEKSWDTGVDVFRIFDSLNWYDSMVPSIKAVNERTGGIAEASICYTGDFLNPKQTKYTLDYYLDFAKKLEDAGAHILAIKDMAGLLKPDSAYELITALKKSVDLPIHLHTHDTSGLQISTYAKAVDAGVHIVDVALSSMSGLTSQPNFNSFAAMQERNGRSEKIDLKKLNEYSNYWENVREQYYPFESGLKASTAEIFDHEIPGGQYSNLRPQARAMGIEDQFETIKENYRTVNRLFGDIVKVTPSSKVVGDMAMFMTSNNLTEQEIMENGHEISFPVSVVNFFKGELGQPHGGFPKKLQKIILKNIEPFTNRPNAHLEPIDFDKEFAKFQIEFNKHCDFLDFLSYKLYPKVFTDFYNHHDDYGEVSKIPTRAFFYGLKPNEEIQIEIEPGKNIIVQYLNRTAVNDEGICSVFFALNGQTRSVTVQDKSVVVTKMIHKKADGDHQIGSPLQGLLAKLFVKEGQAIKKDEALFVLEAMKMETTVTAVADAIVDRIELSAGTLVLQGDLILSFKS